MSSRGVSRSIVYLNGRFLPASRARVQALDRGLLYGDGLFETLLVRAGRPIALREHLQRLRDGARRIGLSLAADREWWRRLAEEVVRRNRLEGGEAAVRITVTRGSGGEGLLPPRKPRPTLLVSARAVDPEVAQHRRRGVRVVFLPFHPGRGGLLAGVKTTAYLAAVIGKEAARRRGAFEGIYTTEDGEVLEGTTSNLFVVRNGRLLTPPASSGILAGVTRRTVLALARRAGLRVAEQKLRKTEVLGAEEAFLTASTLGIVPIRMLEQRCFRPVPGPLTGRLQQLLERAYGAPGRSRS
jgi:aminodeoxychorismate lyase